MTLKALNEHFYIVDRYNTAYMVLQRLRESTGLKAQTLTGMPHGTGINDIVGNMVVEITRMEKMVEELSLQVACSSTPIEAWIETLGDGYIQTIFRLRFLHGLKWTEVAEAVGGGNSADSVKETCYRELRKDISTNCS